MKIPKLPNRIRPVPNALASRGFSLLEVLVAIVVLSFGVLGVVGLQAMALQANKETRHQSTAVALGRELGDMMRSTKNTALVTAAGLNPYLVDFSFTDALPGAPTDCFAAACVGELAVSQFNMNEWLTRLNTALPGVRVVVCFDAAPFDADGRPQWACTAGAGASSVVKIGWARQSGNANANDLERVSGAGATGVPSVVLPLIPGSTT